MMSKSVEKKALKNHNVLEPFSGSEDKRTTRIEVHPKIRDDLRDMLIKIRSHPDSEMFRIPVDTEKYECIEYPKIIKKPMDLQKMLQKLDDGGYDADPWLFVRDFHLIVSNAILFNRNQVSHWVSVKAEQLLNHFRDRIDKMMRKFGYCCGLLRKFEVRALACYAYKINGCQIPKDADYFLYNKEYSVCVVCFENEKLPGGLIKIYRNQEDPEGDSDEVNLPIQEFFKTKNDGSQEEPFVSCSRPECGKKFHKICCNYQSDNDFVCHHCCPITSRHNSKPYARSSEISSQSLIETPLSRYLEKQVEAYHAKERMKDPGLVVPKLRIRVLSTQHKVFNTKPFMGKFYANPTFNFPERFPYTARAIFVFQEQSDGKSEILIFGLHVNEYSDQAKEPNNRRLYMSYLDSVQYFEPKQIRTATYHEIILSYMDFMRRSGFRYVSIWSCPPAKNDDYIFYVHPKGQKMPKSDILLNWYEALFSKGIRKQIIANYCDMARRAQRDEKSDITDYPYLEGDYWPNQIENTLKEVLVETKNKQNFNELIDEINKSIRELMEEEENVKVFFSLELTECDAHDSIEPIGILDIDLDCPIFNGREGFLTLCRQAYMEFGSNRTAIFSTAFIIQKILDQQKEAAWNYFHEVCHALRCTAAECSMFPSCKRYKRLLSIKAPTEMMVKTMNMLPSKGRVKNIKEALFILAKTAITHHVENCHEDHDVLCTRVREEYRSRLSN